MKCTDHGTALSAGGDGRFVEIRGHRLFVAIRGNGIPVVGLHAIGQGSGDFLPLAERAGHTFRFFLVDWPGHGLSPPSPHADAAFYASLVEDLIPQLTSEPVILIGNSVGGAAALTVAAARGAQVRALVLCNSAGLAAIGTFERIATHLVSRFFAAGTRGVRWFPLLYRAYYRLVLPTPATKQRRRSITAAWRCTTPCLATAWDSFSRAEADLRALAPQVVAPVWIAWARHDVIVRWQASRRAVEDFRNVAVSHFAGGHTPFLEAPDEFAHEFIRKYSLKTGPGNWT